MQSKKGKLQVRQRVESAKARSEPILVIQIMLFSRMNR